MILNLLAFSPEALGPAAALAAAALWAVSPMLMASAGRRVGSFPVVLLRSLLASLLLAIVVGAMYLFDSNLSRPTGEQIAWLSFSGFMGMGIGDVLIYEAFVSLGPRRTTQVLVLAPAVAVICGWNFLGEAMTARTLLGIAITLGATFYAIIAGQRRPETLKVDENLMSASTAGSASSSAPAIAAGESGDVEAFSAVAPANVVPAAESNGTGKGAAGARAEPGRVTLIGVLCAVGGAVCMGIGAVSGRQAFNSKLGPAIDPLVATFFRVSSAAIVLWAAPLVRGESTRTLAILKDRQILSRVGTGTLLGPFIGMFCYMAALKLTPAGVVSTLVATSPLFAIPITMFWYRVRIRWDVILAACVALGGVALIFLKY